MNESRRLKFGRTLQSTPRKRYVKDIVIFPSHGEIKETDYEIKDAYKVQFETSDLKRVLEGV
jgi:hypothetical protein